MPAAAPAACEHPLEYPSVKIAPEVWQWFAGADDAVEGQDQRYGSSLLQGRAAADSSKIATPLWPVDDYRARQADALARLSSCLIRDKQRSYRV